MPANFDFSVAELGPRKIASPLALSKVDGDKVANYVEDPDRVRYLNIPAFQEEVGSGLGLLEKAGPREMIYFSPSRVHAAIVSCGGLCPGINDVIRAITRCLVLRYGVTRITGIRYGYQGLLAGAAVEPVELDLDVVDDIHKIGGSMLGSSRGGGEKVQEIVDSLEQLNVNMLFTIGGDGTQKGSLAIAEEAERRGLKVAVVGIPKTIDNDLSFIQRSFGFETAVAKAAEAVIAAHTEAHSYPNGVGLVKLMGRESGFIAAHTCLAVHEANFCLIPEVPFEVEGPNGLLSHLERRLEKSSHAVIVVAEGAGQELVAGDGSKDASGNAKLGDIGLFLKEKIAAHFKASGREINIKYIDPSYIIRSAAATPGDSAYCERLGNNAVHAAMAGKTKVLVGLVRDEFVHIPVAIATQRRNHVDPEGALWRDTIDATQQPLMMKN